MKKEITLDAFLQAHGAIKVLTPDVAASLIQGYTDQIAPEAKADDAFYRQFCCPSCHSDMIREFLGGPRGAGTTWVPGCATPQALLRCIQCKLLMNPRSGLIIEQGDFVPTIPLDDDIPR